METIERTNIDALLDFTDLDDLNIPDIDDFSVVTEDATNAEAADTLESTKQEADNSIEALNLAMKNNQAADIATALERTKQAIERLNVQVILRRFDDLLSEESPALAFLENPTAQTYMSKLDKKLNRYSLANKMEVLDMLALHTRAAQKKQELFNDPTWLVHVNGLLCGIYRKSAADKGITTFGNRYNSQSFTDVQRQYGESLESNGSWERTLQKVLDAIYFSPIGENSILNRFKVEMRDVRFLFDHMHKLSNTSIYGTVFMQESTFRKLLVRVFSRAVMGKDYTAD